jgi:hypothetical protein
MTDTERIQELEREVERLRHRLEGHREAVARWRRKAGVEPPTGDMELYKSEVYLFRDGWKCREYYTLPIEKTPDLLAEAWAWLLENHLTEICERVTFEDRRGWTVTLTKDWQV